MTVTSSSYEAHLAKCWCCCADWNGLGTKQVLVIVNSKGGQPMQLDLLDGASFYVHAPWKQLMMEGIIVLLAFIVTPSVQSA
eukprot:gene13581-19456_t